MAGRVVVINKKGQDGASFSLTGRSCVFGRQGDCDIRIVKPNVSLQHARLRQDENHQVWLQNLSETNVTLLNNAPFTSDVLVKHGDVFTICDRSFRFELDAMPAAKSATPAKAATTDTPAESLKPRSTPPQPRPPQSVGASPRPRSILTKEPGSGRRKSVVMGPPLSPEVFDKELPPATPLKRGAKAPGAGTPAASAAPAARTSASKTRTPSRLSLSSSSPQPVLPAPSLSQAAPDLISFDLSPPKAAAASALAGGQSADASRVPAGSSMLSADTTSSAVVSSPTLAAPVVLLTPATKPASAQVAVEQNNSTTRVTAMLSTPAAAESGKRRGPASSRLALSMTTAATLTPKAVDVARSFAASLSRTPRMSQSAMLPDSASTARSLADELKEAEVPLIAFTPARPATLDIAAEATPPATPRQTPAVSSPSSSSSASKTAMERLRERQRLATPLRTAIAAGPSLRPIKKVLALPLQAQIAMGIALKKRTYPALPGPVAASIQAQPTLRVTKKKLQTPLRHAIQSGSSLRSTKPPTMPTPLRTAIRAGVALKAKEPLPALPSPLRRDIRAGVALQPKLHALPALPSPVRRDLAHGVVLRSTLPAPALPASVLGDIRAGAAVLKTRPAPPSLPAEVKQQIQAGITLRTRTRAALPSALAAEIKAGRALRPTRRALPADLRREIAAPHSLKSTRMRLPKLATPLRKAIGEGRALAPIGLVSRPRIRPSLGAAIQAGVALKSKPAMRKSLGAAIRAGVTLKAKPKMRKSLAAQIAEGVNLRATKRTLPAVLLASLQAPAVLRATNNLAAVEAKLQHATLTEPHCVRTIRRLCEKRDLLLAIGAAKERKPVRLTAMQRLRLRTVLTKTTLVTRSQRPAETEAMIALRAHRLHARQEAARAADGALVSLRSILRISPAPTTDADYEGLADLFAEPQATYEETLVEAAAPLAQAQSGAPQQLDLGEMVSVPMAKTARASRRKSITGGTADSSAEELQSSAPKKKFAPRIPEPPRVDVAAMTVAELKARLAALGRPVDGRKSDLMKRLSAALEPCPPANDEVSRVELKKRKLSIINERLEESDTEPAPAAQSAHTLLTPEAVAGFAVARLREELAARGLSTAGLKPELRSRLLSAVAAQVQSAAPDSARFDTIAESDIVPVVTDTKGVSVAAELQPLRVVKKARRGRAAAPTTVESSAVADNAAEAAAAQASEPAVAAAAVAVTAAAAAAATVAAAEVAQTSVHDAAAEVPAASSSKAKQTKRGRGQSAAKDSGAAAATAAPAESPIAPAASVVSQQEVLPAVETAITAATKGRGKRAAREAATSDPALAVLPPPAVDASLQAEEAPRSKRARSAPAQPAAPTAPAAPAAAVQTAPVVTAASEEVTFPTAAAIAAAADVASGRPRRSRRN